MPGDGPNVKAKRAIRPRMRLFDFIERLVKWESTTDEKIMGQARELIRIATNGNPPPLLDPFAGGGSIPLEAQRLGLEAHASDLNPVAVMINKAMIEIPPRFADMPPVNPRDRKNLFSGRGDPVLRPRWKGAAGLAADVRYYGEWMRERAFEKIGHLYPKHNGETVIAWLLGAHGDQSQSGGECAGATGAFLRAEQEEGARVLGEADYRRDDCAL